MKGLPSLPHIRTFLLTFAFSTASVTSAGITQAQTASRTTFSCQTNAGVPTTMARTRRGEVLPIIRWKYDGFRDWSPEQRCQEISRRFQQYNELGELNYLTTGMMNSQKVICTTSHPQGGCRNLLLTVRPGANPRQTLLDLLAVRSRSSAGPVSETDGRIYISIDDLIENARQSPLGADNPGDIW